MERRAYGDADLPSLQQAFTAWVAEAGPCGYGHVGDLPHRIYEDLHPHGAPEELVEVWERHGEILGVAISLRFACAFDVFAAPSARGTELELEMLRAAAETTTARLGDEERFVLSDVFDCDATRIAGLIELGFEHFRNWDHFRERDLRDPISASDPPTGFVVRSARTSDAEQLALARNSALGSGWTGGAFRAKVMEKPGYEPERELVVEAPDGRIAAFATYWVDDRNGAGHFEPVGTHADFRRRGLARTAMLEAAHGRARDANGDDHARRREPSGAPSVRVTRVPEAIRDVRLPEAGVAA
jgi:GNAT superfamily N-acetyltransferase